MSKLTEDYNKLVLIRDGDDLEDRWIILSEGSGRSCQLFTEREAIYKLLHLPKGQVGRIYSAVVVFTKKGLVNEHQLPIPADEYTGARSFFVPLVKPPANEG